MQSRWSPRASAELDAIYEYIARDNETAAIRQIRLILAAVRQLESFPESGRSSLTHSRELAVPRTPYLIRYKIVGDVIKILSVTHGARNKS